MVISNILTFTLIAFKSLLNLTITLNHSRWLAFKKVMHNGVIKGETIWPYLIPVNVYNGKGPTFRNWFQCTLGYLTVALWCRFVIVHSAAYPCCYGCLNELMWALLPAIWLLSDTPDSWNRSLAETQMTDFPSRTRCDFYSTHL